MQPKKSATNVIKIDMQPTNSIFSDFPAHFYPGIVGQGNMICLICAAKAMEMKQLHRAYVHKSGSQNKRSHLFQKHRELLDNPTITKRETDLIIKHFPTKVLSGKGKSINVVVANGLHIALDNA